jgi:hypothetical protein
VAAAKAAPLSIPHHARGAWVSCFFGGPSRLRRLPGSWPGWLPPAAARLDEVRLAQPVSPSRPRVITGACEARAGSKFQRSRTVLRVLGEPIHRHGEASSAFLRKSTRRTGLSRSMDHP